MDKAVFICQFTGADQAGVGSNPQVSVIIASGAKGLGAETFCSLLFITNLSVSKGANIF
jgi:hypothetical protein